jgi:hypothetical protein
MVTLQKIQVDPRYGLRQTLSEMNQLEYLSKNNKSFVNFVNRNFKSECLACVPGLIWNYMQANFKYVKDDPFDEVIRAPHVLLTEKIGDCDDFSLFAKTCLDIIGGYNTNYILLAKNKNEFTHILVLASRNLNGFVDAVYIDGANKTFNVISDQYKFYKIVK